MTRDLIPSNFWQLPRIPSLWESDEDWSLLASSIQSGLSISEDEKNIYVEAALPGIDPKDVEITFDKGILWIKGEKKEEEKGRKFYKKASSAFSYRITVPGEIDANVEPQAESKNGMMKVTFAKSPASQPKKITIKG